MRGAWIEIARSGAYQPHEASRSPCGERGLKLAAANFQALLLGRSPCGERGLKSYIMQEDESAAAVAPRAGSVD